MCEGDGGGGKKMRTTSERNMKERGVKKMGINDDEGEWLPAVIRHG